MPSTRRILERVPEASFSWQPHEKSMTLGRLAAHVTETAGEWPIDALSKPGLDFDMTGYKPWSPATKAEILEKFDTDSAKAKEILSTLDPARWDDNWKMTAGDQTHRETWIDDTRYNVFRNWVLNHLIHHRAQLGRDLRTLGVPIPGCYGPSADEM